MKGVSGDFELTVDELREATRFVAESAQAVLPVFESVHLDDPRPRVALSAAREFIAGSRRTALQRVTSLDAHRAAKDAATEVARLAARAAGDTSSAAYLHPIAKAHQVGHLLRAAASAARIAEIEASDDPSAGLEAVEQAQLRARTLIDDEGAAGDRHQLRD